MASSQTISFEPRQSTNREVVTSHGDGTIYHDVELFIWKLRQSYPHPSTPIEAPRILGPETLRFTEFHDIGTRPVSAWIELLRAAFGTASNAARSINDALVAGQNTVDIDTSRIYRITKRGSDLPQALSFNPKDGNMVILPIGTTPTQLWYFVIKHNSPSPWRTYAIRNITQGNTKSVDVVNSHGVESRRLAVVPSGRYSGQAWTIWRWQGNEIGSERGVYGDVKLTNSFTREHRCMTLTEEDGSVEAVLGDVTNDHSQDMHWDLVDVGALEMVRDDLGDQLAE